MIKKFLMAILAVLMVISCTSCKLMVIDETKDLEQVVATVNGVEITKADVMAVYHTYRYYYSLTDENELTEQYKTSRITLLDSVYDTLIEYELIQQYAGEMTNIELTDEMREAIEEDIRISIASIETGADSVLPI